MRPHAVIAALVLAFIVAPSAAVGAPEQQDKTIPERFHGEWSSELARCGDRESGTNLTINADSITYFEAGDKVVSVTPAESNGIHIVVDHEDYEGMERLSQTLILSDDMQKLSFTYGDGPEFVALRCPEGNPDGE